MATAYVESLRVAPSGAAEHDLAPLSRTLAAVRRLADASGALLATVDAAGVARADGRAAVTPGSAEEAALLAAAQRGASMWGGAGPRWTLADGTTPAIMSILVEPADRDAPSSVLLLAFAAAPAAVRSQATAMAPDLAALVAAQLEAEARVRDLRARQAAAAIALDHDACGVIALRADHSVLFANGAASAMLAAGDGLQLRRGLVRPSDYRCAVRFEAALDAVLDGAQTGLAGNASALVMLLPRAGDGRPMITVIAPADAPGDPDGSAAECGALLYVLQPGPGLMRGVDTLAQLHDLSRVETRLLAHLCEGMTVSESAVAMRIKLETARAYLKQIFAKTGTHRQGELVALMSRYLRAVRGDFDFRAA